ncbi:MAG: tRNA (adenosine(37)-N6)-threonylcarbamoyltransferase complex ATPase subunit type 1 TsaE [Rudaea sp.]
MVDAMSAAGFSATVDEGELAAVARSLAQQAGDGGVIHLIGDLGAGKTTFARALLGALGVGERIKSPTYSLIESYMAGDLRVHHLDLYRIVAPDELEWLGLADLADERFLLVTEWPERAGEALPEPDLLVRLAHAGARRALQMEARSARGERWLSRLAMTG